MLAVIPRNNGGCHGAKRKYYSPDNKYSRRGENVINATLKRGNKNFWQELIFEAMPA
ncbi:MAG: hypothetical protein U9M90_03400 [Patescibacteria group bacterium]|nr:hypothetical protein [Patescibacteria group bacterium]